ncbi:unnamed protein product, partial [Ixodes pacificus]
RERHPRRQGSAGPTDGDGCEVGAVRAVASLAEVPVSAARLQRLDDALGEDRLPVLGVGAHGLGAEEAAVNLLGEGDAHVLGDRHLGSEVGLTHEQPLAHILAAVDGVGVQAWDAFSLDDTLAYFNGLVGNQVQRYSVLQKLVLDVRVAYLAPLFVAVRAGHDDDGLGDTRTEGHDGREADGFEDVLVVLVGGRSHGLEPHLFRR